jgi:2-keto-4-pentenoate hydratase
VAAIIWSAWRSGERLAALPAAVRPGSIEDGWAAQRALSGLAGPAYGWKIAATSTAGQAHIGVTGPLPGPLFERFRHEPGAVLASADLHMRVVEAEFAFRMGADVPAGASSDDVEAAVAALHLAVEVPDSRFVDFAAVGGPSLLADAACAGSFVLGPEVPGWRGADLAARRTRIEVNGEVVADGSGAAVLGDPRSALAWVAAELARLGGGLRAGEVVTTGTTTSPPPIGPGDEVRAWFEDAGEVRLSFAR